LPFFILMVSGLFPYAFWPPRRPGLHQAFGPAALVTILWSLVAVGMTAKGAADQGITGTDRERVMLITAAAFSAFVWLSLLLGGLFALQQIGRMLAKRRQAARGGA